GSFCGTTCESDSDCRDGYACQQSEELETGQTSPQCVPTGGQCTCSPRAIIEAASTECSNGGACLGQRFCGDSGLTACDSLTPAEEACDGLDNNCNGFVDESFVDTDADALANCVDPDDDNDGVLDPEDNCPLADNPDQSDNDDDGIGDVCDVPDTPILTGSSPPSPANENSLSLLGTGEANTLVKVFTNEFCEGVAVAQNIVQASGAFAIPVSVQDDTTTPFFAASSDSVGTLSPCSTTSVVYVEDSTPPAAPEPQGSEPSSPTSSLSPAVTGEAEAGATVTLFTDDACSGDPAGDALAEEAPGSIGAFAVAVAPLVNATTTYFGVATDAAGNVSACSAVGLPFVHDDIAPEPPIFTGTVPESPSSISTFPVILGQAEGGASVTLYLEPGCAGQPIADDVANDVSGSWSATAIVEPNTVTTFFATATDPAGNTSACTVDFIVFIADSEAPGSPVLTHTTPTSPGNSLTPLVHGLSEPLTTVFVYLKSDCTGVSVGSGAADLAGAFAVSSTVAENVETILYARSVDTVGFESPCSAQGLSYQHDGVPPAALVFEDSSPPSPSQSTTPVVNGTAEPGSTVQLFASSSCAGESIGDSLTSGGGSFSVPVVVAENQETTLYGLALDVAGNPGPCTDDPFVYVHDTIAPSAPVLTGTSPSPPSSSLVPVVQGLSEADATITIHTDAQCSFAPVGSAIVAGNGSFNAIATVQANQDTPLFARATDAAGNASPCSLSFTYQHDDTQPNLPTLIATVPTSPSSSVFNPQVVGETDPGSVVRLYTQGGCGGVAMDTQTADPNGDFSCDAFVLPNSKTLFFATSQDPAGNLSPCTPEGLEYIHDNKAPTPPTLTETVPESPSSTALSPTVKGQTEPGAHLQLYTQSGCLGLPAAEAFATPSGTFEVPVGVLADTTTLIAATATDEAGNTSGCSQALAFVNDQTPPAAIVLFGTSPPSPSNVLNPTIQGSTEPEAVVTLFQEANCLGQPVATAFASAVGGFEMEAPAGANQTTIFSAHASDPVGNISACSNPIGYLNDVAAPAVPVLTGTEPVSPSATDTQPTLLGLGEVGSIVNIYKNASCSGAAFISLPVNADGTFGIVILVQANWLTTFSADAEDGVGNVSACSDSLAYVHDDSPPPTPVWLSSNPTSPSPEGSPTLIGTTEAFSNVVLYTGADCTGDPLSVAIAGGDGQFEFLLPGPVDANTTTAFYARATDIGGNISACSVALEYTHDDVAPDAPVLDQTLPASPSANPSPLLQGLAEPEATITLYTDGACATVFPGTGQAGQAGTWSVGLGQAVVANTTTAFFATATDAAGNVSPCSTTFLIYEHDNVAPPAPVLTLVDPFSPNNQSTEPLVWGFSQGGATEIQVFTGAGCQTLIGAFAPFGDGSFSAQVTVAENSQTDFFAKAADGAGNVSGCSQAKTYIHDNIPPAFPEGYVGPTINVQGGIDVPNAIVEWPSATDNFTPTPEIVYEICVSEQCNDLCEPWAPATATPGGQVSHTVENLEPNTRYYFMVRGRDLATNLDTNIAITSVKTQGKNVAEALSLGGDTSCVFQSTGNRQCWGNNSAGPDELDVLASAHGSGHSCLVRFDGTLECQGDNSSGQLGAGDTAPTSQIVIVAGLTAVVGVAVGDEHTCALQVDGHVYCWGFNEHLAVGLGDDFVLTPSLLTQLDGSPFDDAVKIFAGGEHNCLLRGDGTAWCWGFNWAGQLGATAGAVSPVPVAVDVSDAGGFTDLALGTDHTCGLSVDGRIFCWGVNNDGQLGLGLGSGFSEPLPVDTGIAQAVDVTAAASHSCAALANGTASCWGRNDSGQLGANVATLSSKVPLTVVEQVADGVFGDLAAVVAVDSGIAHNCALLANGQVVCWGENGSKQLGNNKNVDRPYADFVTQILGISHLTGIARHSGHSCARLSDGSARCWGVNDQGQAGQLPSASASVTVIPVPVDGQALSVVPGKTHSCAIVLGGEVYCWGGNDDGQLGFDGAGTNLPTKVLGLSAPARQLALGDAHTCALLTTGALSCWGANLRGQLGNNSNQSIATPQSPIGIDGQPGGFNAIAVAAGDLHTCAILAGQGVNAVRCWGAGDSGQLGAALAGDHNTPQLVSGLSARPRSLSGGRAHTCASLSNGTATCWGDNTAAQSGGAGTFGQAVSITAGASHTCGLRFDNSVQCWGNNTNGQLGNASTQPGLGPTDIIGLDTARTISAGDQSTCAVATNGIAYCWGDNTDNILGTVGAKVHTTPSAVQCLP
ncbi:MAG: alpha-tubulin suppressor-like RCC1 family protein, partial [Myxococcota bacterium]